MPYYPLGYPDSTTSTNIIQAIASYSDVIELGIPFSDPLADGPTVQRSTQRALEQGTTTERCLDQVAQLRSSGVDTPLLLMGYFNPILSFGVERFVRAAATAGADGFIVPDLPPEEADELAAAAADAGLALIYLLAPTSGADRIRAVAERASGFIYLVSVTGVTGARTEVHEGLTEFVNRVRAFTSLPLAVGFGISTPEQVAGVGAAADGVIVGSALLNRVAGAENKVEAAVEYVQSLRAALEF